MQRVLFTVGSVRAMDDILKTFLTSLGSTGVLLALVWWWLQRYLDRRLTAHFSALEARLKGEAEAAVGLRKKRLEKTADLLPQLQRSASECRHRLRELNENLDDSAVLKFWEARESYVDILYGSQLLLLPRTYEAAHTFKSVLDKVNMLLGENSTETEKPELHTGLRRTLSELDDLYHLLQDSLRKDLRILEQQPGEGNI